MGLITLLLAFHLRHSASFCYYIIQCIKELNQTFPAFKMKDLTIMFESSFPFDEQRDRLSRALGHSLEVLLLEGNS